MSKTIVNIIDKSNPLPAYLFTKEYFEDGDELLFISAAEEANCKPSSSIGIKTSSCMSASAAPSREIWFPTRNTISTLRAATVT